MSHTQRVSHPERQIPALIESIYAAGVDMSLWPDAVERIRVALGGSTALLATLESRPQQGGFSYSRQLGNSDFVEWGRFSQHSAWLEGWKRLGSPQDRVFLAEEIAPWKVLSRSVVFNDYFKPRDMVDSATVALFNGRPGAPPMTAFCLTKGGTRHISLQEAQVLQTLVPHLKRALLVSAALTHGDATRRAHLAVLEQVATGVILVGRQQQVLYVNPAAQRLLEAGDGLLLVGGRLLAGRPEETALLTRLIGQTVQGTAPGGSGSLRLPRHSQPTPLQVTVVPIQQAGELFPQIDAVAGMVTVVDPDAAQPVAPHALAGRFRLTRTETVVLMALLQGAAPAAIAERQGISVRTVRMHLEHLFQKTGARRQADLVRMALSGNALDWPS